MADETMGNLIDTRIDYKIDQIPVSRECRIVKVYNDGYVDAEIENGRFSYIKCIGSASINSSGLIIFINGNHNNPVVIVSDFYTKKEIDKIVEEIISGKSDTGHTHTVDSSLSSTSENPVQNKVINSALNGKSNTGHTHTSSNITDLINTIYPVGSLYFSAKNVNPATLFGVGTWTKIEDRFLLASGSSYSATYDNDGFANNTGGEATHSLTESEMPRHTHIQNAHNHTQVKHSHTFPHYQQNGSTTNYSASWVSQKTATANTSEATPTINDKTATNKYTGGTGGAESASDGVAHNNMPPYLVINVWKRTA